MKLLQNANQLSYKVLNKIFIKLETRIKLHKNFREKKKKKLFSWGCVENIREERKKYYQRWNKFMGNHNFKVAPQGYLLDIIIIFIIIYPYHVLWQHDKLSNHWSYNHDKSIASRSHCKNLIGSYNIGIQYRYEAVEPYLESDRRKLFLSTYFTI